MTSALPTPALPTQVQQESTSTKANRARVATALLHHPCVDKHGKIYTTSITNLDVHDIARSSKTYGVDAFYVVTPIQAQQEMAKAIAAYWDQGGGRVRNPSRTEAMEIVRVVASLEEAVAMEAAIRGNAPPVWATSAKLMGARTVSYAEARPTFLDQGGVLIFGTGHGLAPHVVNAADYVLEPLPGADGYNHLSVRSAAAIIIDRLLHFS